MSYDMSWVDAPGPGDEVVTDKGVTVLVDRKASLFLIGTVMDYEVKALSVRLHLHQPEREGPLRLRREFPRLIRMTVRARDFAMILSSEQGRQRLAPSSPSTPPVSIPTRTSSSA